MKHIIEASDITKTFANGKIALDNVSVNVPEGAIYGLLGPNGAGKTTLIRIINHITAPDAGTVTFDGHPLTQNDVEHIGYLPEERGLYKKMKVGEQALFFARLKGLSRHDATIRLTQWFDRLGISDWWNKKVEELSKGMAQKVQFIITVLHNPKLLIFDEPFSGFDPINAKMLKDEILELRRQGATVIFSSHNMASVEEICDEITLINQGHNILTGNVKQIRQEYSDGRFMLDFTGDPARLAAALKPLTTDLEFIDSPLEEASRLRMHLEPGTDLKSVISTVNEVTEIRAVNPDIASLNDIFIKTVGEKLSLTKTAE